MEYLDLGRFAVGAALLAYAALADLRTRRVEDWVWLAMGSIGFLLLGVQMLDADLGVGHLTMLVAPAVLFYDVFWDRDVLYDPEKGKVGLPAVAAYSLASVFLIIAIYTLGFNSWTVRLLMIPAMILFAYLLYYLGVLHGGADAKAFMAIAILCPFYPRFWGFPLMEYSSFLDLAFPFPLTVLFTSAVLLLAVPIFLLFYNLAKGDTGFPQMFLGYRRGLEGIEDSFVWPMEDVRDGELVMQLRPARDEGEEQLARLRKHGVERLWVTPKMPFMVPLVVGFIISVIAGNALYLLLGFGIG